MSSPPSPSGVFPGLSWCDAFRTNIGRPLFFPAAQLDGEAWTPSPSPDARLPIRFRLPDDFVVVPPDATARSLRLTSKMFRDSIDLALVVDVLPRSAQLDYLDFVRGTKDHVADSSAEITLAGRPVHAQCILTSSEASHSFGYQKDVWLSVLLHNGTYLHLRYRLGEFTDQRWEPLFQGIIASIEFTD